MTTIIPASPEAGVFYNPKTKIWTESTLIAFEIESAGKEPLPIYYPAPQKGDMVLRQEWGGSIFDQANRKRYSNRTAVEEATA